MESKSTLEEEVKIILYVGMDYLCIWNKGS
jgi:hypothetical protein